VSNSSSVEDADSVDGAIKSARKSDDTLLTSSDSLGRFTRLLKALTAGLPNYRKFEIREMEKKNKILKNHRTVIVGFGSVRVLCEFVNGGF